MVTEAPALGESRIPMTPTVLVVDDEPAVADKYTTILRAEYTVRSAYSGESAVESMDSDIDVVLLDRRMPDLSGDEVLEEIETRDIDCQVAMVTGIEPDFDILEMPFDDYLVKPASSEELQDTVDHLLARSEFDAALQEYTSLVSKRVVLIEEKPDSELSESPEFHELTARIDSLRNELEDQITELDYEDAFEIVAGDIDHDQT